MEDGDLNSLIEGLSNSNQSSQLVLAQQLQHQAQQQQNPQTHFVVSSYPSNSYLPSDSSFSIPSPSQSIILRSPAPIISPIPNIPNIKSPIPVRSPGFQNVKSPGQTFQNVKSPTNFPNVKSPNVYQVKSPGITNIKSPVSGVSKSPANIRSPGVCNPQSPAQAHSPFQYQVSGSPNNNNSCNRSPAPPPPTPSPTVPSPARANTPQPSMSQYPPNASNASVQYPQTGQIIGRTQMTCGGSQAQMQKSKQPLQILPKPLTTSAGAPKQTVSRLNATSIQQQTPLLINQAQSASPALVLNQVLASGGPVIVQPTAPGGACGTVHLMLRPPAQALQSGPGPPQNKMIITNATQAQAQATVLIPNRQQVMRIMTAQGPMQLQQIQTPNGTQFIAIPQNQALSFPANSVLVQSSPTSTIQVQPPTGSNIQLHQNSANAIQLQQSSSAMLQSTAFPSSSLPVASSQIAVQSQALQPNSVSSCPMMNKRDEKGISTDGIDCPMGTSEQKKVVIDNKINSKKITNTVNINTVNSSNSNLSNSNMVSLSNNSMSSNVVNNNNNNSNINNKKMKSVKGKGEEELVNKCFAKMDSAGTSAASSNAQKNITTSLRQIRPGAFANRNRQNQNTEAKDKPEESTKNLNNLTRIIDSVASNTEHLISSPPPKIDNLTATINSVAENIKSPVQDEIMSNLSFSDVFISGNKTLSLNKRPNLTIVQKSNKVTPPESEEPNLTINRLVMSPGPHSSVDFTLSESYDSLELGGVMTSAGVQTSDIQSFLVDQNSSSSLSTFPSQDDPKKGKKKTYAKKKAKKEENRVDLWDLMKSAGIGDDEFDEPSDVSTFSQDAVKIAEGLEVSSADTELLTQLQSASQLPNNIRVIVGEDGRPVFINGNNVLVPDAVHSGSACAAEPSEANPVFPNMILPDNVFNVTPQALATAQNQLSQLIQDHGGLSASSADQQLLSQIFGSQSSSINSGASTSTIVTNTSSSNAAMQPPGPALLSSNQSHSQITSTRNESVMVNVNPSNSEVTQTNMVQKPEMKSEFIGGPPPGLPPLGPDSLVITNNNGVPTLVASPALMQYLQTHQGIIQFQHDPITKTIQPSLIIPHPQPKIEVPSAAHQDIRNDKIPPVMTSSRNVSQPKEATVAKPRTEQKSSVGTTTEEPRNVGGVMQMTERSNLMFRDDNKGLCDKDIVEVDRKMQPNRAVLDQCVMMGNSRTNQNVPAAVPNVIIKEGANNEAVFYQVSSVGVGSDKFPGSVTVSDNKTTETQTLDDLQHLEMGSIKAVQTNSAAMNSNPNTDFQTKFLESIGMANKVTKMSVGTGTSPSPSAPASAATPTPTSMGMPTPTSMSMPAPTPMSMPTPTPLQSSPAKRGRKKKVDKIQNQATQVDGKMEMTFNIAQLTPEQNLKLNQALQSRGVTASHVHNFDAIKQIIQEEIRKITAGTLQNTSIRFVSAPSFQQTEEARDTSDQNTSSSRVMYNNQNLNQVMDHPTSQGNIISLQGNDVVAINNGNQRIFASQNQLLSSGHLVASNNQILAIGGNHNQLVSLGNAMNTSNQIVTLGNSSNMMSMNGNNVAAPGSVIVGSNGNVVAIVHQTPVSNQGSGIVQRLQTIQLSTPKQQVPQQMPSQSGRFQTQGTQHGQQVQSQPAQSSAPVQQNSNQQMYVTNANVSNAQACKTSFTTHTAHTAVSCGTNTSDMTSAPPQPSAPKLSTPPALMISEAPSPNYGPLYVSPSTSGKNVTKCEKGTSPIQIQMGTQTATATEYKSGKMSTGTMTSPNTGKPQAVVAPAIVIQSTEAQSPTWQSKSRGQQSSSPSRNQVSALSRTTFIEQQMRTDQAGAAMPDTHTPFLSKSDACKRLIRYHVMEEKGLSPQDLATADDMFEATAQHLLDKFRAMKEKYKYLLMLESMREVSTAERIMVDRNFIIEERIELEALREREKRLKEEFENPTISYSSTGEENIPKTEVMYDDAKTKKESDESFCPEEIKSDCENDLTAVADGGIDDIPEDPLKENPFKLMELNRNYDPAPTKSETKECKNARGQRVNRSRSQSPDNDDFGFNISGKCKVKSNRTFSDGSSKSSLDSSNNDDSGTDINAQVQSAIDSILNLQKCETNSPEDCSSMPKKKKKRKNEDSSMDDSKRVKTRDDDEKRMSSEESDFDDACEFDADHLLDEAIRSITS